VRVLLPKCRQEQPKSEEPAKKKTKKLVVSVLHVGVLSDFPSHCLRNPRFMLSRISFFVKTFIYYRADLRAEPIKNRIGGNLFFR